MKTIQMLLILMPIVFCSCQKSHDDFIYETRLQEGIKKGKELNKPVFIYFYGYDCIPSFDFLKFRKIRKILEQEYISVFLFVDDQNEIQSIDTLNLKSFNFSERNWNIIKKAKTKGEINAITQIEFYNHNSQPYYIIVNPEMKNLIKPFDSTDIDRYKFLNNLIKGVEQFEMTK